MRIIFACLVLLLVGTSVYSKPLNKRCHTVYCFVAPCTYSSCPNYPTAECRNDYCNGCFARYYVNNKLVDCKPKKG